MVNNNTYSFTVLCVLQFRQDIGSAVYVAIEGRLDTFYQATLEHLGPDNCSVLYNEKQVSCKPSFLPHINLYPQAQSLSMHQRVHQYKHMLKQTTQGTNAPNGMSQLLF